MIIFFIWAFGFCSVHFIFDFLSYNRGNGTILGCSFLLVSIISGKGTILGALSRLRNVPIFSFKSLIYGIRCKKLGKVAVAAVQRVSFLFCESVFIWKGRRSLPPGSSLFPLTHARGTKRLCPPGKAFLYRWWRKWEEASGLFPFSSRGDSEAVDEYVALERRGTEL